MDFYYFIFIYENKIVDLVYKFNVNNILNYKFSTII